MLSLEDHWPPVGAREGFSNNGRAVRPNGGADGHKEAAHNSISPCLPGRAATYPNVAADPIMYCPKVRSIPLGPGPKRTMFVKPTYVSDKPLWAMRLEHTEYEANDQTNSWTGG